MRHLYLVLSRYLLPGIRDLHNACAFSSDGKWLALLQRKSVASHKQQDSVCLILTTNWTCAHSFDISTVQASSVTQPLTPHPQIHWSYRDTYLIIRDHPLYPHYFLYSLDGTLCFSSLDARSTTHASKDVSNDAIKDTSNDAIKDTSLGFCSVCVASSLPLFCVGGCEGLLQVVDSDRLLLLRELCVFSSMGAQNTAGHGGWSDG